MAEESDSTDPAGLPVRDAQIAKNRERRCGDDAG
jgi:hypothetical protein